MGCRPITAGYNVQIAVDAEHHLIVAHDATSLRATSKHNHQQTGPSSAAPPHSDGLRHPPLKLLLRRAAAIQGRHYSRGLTAKRICCRWRISRSEERARCGIAVPDLTNGHQTSGDGAFSPSAQRRPERRPALAPAKALRRPAPPRLKHATAPLA
jgi:hypothetical protein